MRWLVILAKRKDTWIKIVGLRINKGDALIVEILSIRRMNVRSWINLVWGTLICLIMELRETMELIKEEISQSLKWMQKYLLGKELIRS
jgi:hypothetical protein